MNLGEKFWPPSSVRQIWKSNMPDKLVREIRPLKKFITYVCQMNSFVNRIYFVMNILYHIIIATYINCQIHK